MNIYVSKLKTKNILTMNCQSLTQLLCFSLNTPCVYLVLQILFDELICRINLRLYREVSLKKSLEIQRLNVSTAFAYSISTSTTARDQEAASGSFFLYFLFVHAYCRKVQFFLFRSSKIAKGLTLKMI